MINIKSNNMDEKKLEILKDLIIDEKYTLEDLKRLVQKSKPFIKIENKSGNIIISSEFQLTVSEKIIVYLIGIYFSKELGFHQDIDISSRNISENIGIAQTTISGPLGEHIKNNTIKKENHSYSIKYYQIEKQLDYLTENNLLKTVKDTSIPPKKSKTTKKKKIINKNENIKSNSQEKIRSIQEDSMKNELVKYDLTKDKLYSVINISNNKIILLRGWKGTSTRERHFKATILILTINKIIYGLDEINSSELRECLINAGVPIKNLSTTIKSYFEYIIHKRGAIGSTKTSYRITSIGFQKGILLLKDIIENTSNFDIQFKRNERSKLGKEIADKISIDREELNQNIILFAKDNGLDEERLRILFEFHEGGVRISTPIKEKIRSKMQIKTLLLLGILLKKVFRLNEFNGKILLKESRTSIERLDLLNKAKHYEKYFSINKPKTAMQLTYAGEKKAIEMLESYIDKEDCQL
ncbi:hypothetical protein LCGC14_0786280 [marine sediment metagenome]|uniref:Uncharacterized protein n=1 Tax=marine sediment metagenome TaxID=412755 RepID=A0A0F9SDU8_9ZZZZ